MGGSRRGTKGRTLPPPPKNHKKYRVPSNSGPDPLKKYKSEQASIQFRAIIGTPAKRHLNGVSLAGLWWPDYSGIRTDRLSHLKKRNKTCQSWIPSEKNFLDPHTGATEFTLLQSLYKETDWECLASRQVVVQLDTCTGCIKSQAFKLLLLNHANTITLFYLQGQES